VGGQVTGADRDEASLLLADFLDWYDVHRGSLQPPFDAEDVVGRFVSSTGASPDSTMLAELVETARESLLVEQLAAEATLDWLGCPLDVVDNDGDLPRPFGDYTLLAVAGRGGMGVVYKARQERLGRIVCVKMIPPGLLDSARIDRFVQESRVAGGLQHPGVVAVYDAGWAADQPYFVMEYVAGETLSQRVARQPLEASAAARILDEVAAAIEYAHARGVLHRDLKPANVLLDNADRPRVTDFGLARTFDGTHSATGVVGTPSYMAPEQADAHRSDERTDVYGLGAILYEMLTGRPPHVGDNPVATLRLVQSEEPMRPGRLRPGLSGDLETLCL
jgi:serine/threonine protein kinase